MVVWYIKCICRIAHTHTITKNPHLCASLLLFLLWNSCCFYCKHGSVLIVVYALASQNKTKTTTKKITSPHFMCMVYTHTCACMYYFLFRLIFAFIHSFQQQNKFLCLQHIKKQQIYTFVSFWFWIWFLFRVDIFFLFYLAFVCKPKKRHTESNWIEQCRLVVCWCFVFLSLRFGFCFISFFSFTFVLFSLKRHSTFFFIDLNIFVVFFWNSFTLFYFSCYFKIE